MDRSEVVLKFISVVLAMLILHPQKLYLSFYWAVSAHLLTVMYQMMLEQVKKYGSCCVIRVWMCVLLLYFISLEFHHILT